MKWSKSSAAFCLLWRVACLCPSPETKFSCLSLVWATVKGIVKPFFDSKHWNLKSLCHFPSFEKVWKYHLFCIVEYRTSWSLNSPSRIIMDFLIFQWLQLGTTCFCSLVNESIQYSGFFQRLCGMDSNWSCRKTEFWEILGWVLKFGWVFTKSVSFSKTLM